MLLGPAFRRGINQACFVPPLQLLPARSHLHTRALEHEPCRSLSRQGFVHCSETWFDWPATGQWLKNEGGVHVQHACLVWCSCLLLKYEKKSLLLALYNVPSPSRLMPTNFVSSLSCLPGPSSASFHSTFPPLDASEQTQSGCFCRLEFICDLISVQNLNSQILQDFVGAPKQYGEHSRS